MTFFKNKRFLNIGNEHFLAKKFSGWNNANFKYNIVKGEVIVKYYIELYFSGNVATLVKTISFPTHVSDSWFANNTEEFNFVYSLKYKNIYDEFNKCNYPSKNSDFIPDVLYWFAEKTKTTSALNLLKEDLEFCLKFIEESFDEKSE